MPKNFLIKQLKQQFAERPLILREELFDFYRTFEPDLNESTFGWRIFSLKRQNILRSVGIGVYTIDDKTQFHPHLLHLNLYSQEETLL